VGPTLGLRAWVTRGRIVDSRLGGERTADPVEGSELVGELHLERHVSTRSADATKDARRNG